MTKQKLMLNELACFISHDRFPSETINGVSVDSRLIQPGEVFFALTGARVDGHLFLQEVAAKGCRVAIVHQSYTGPSFGLRLIKVDHPLEALQKISKNIIALRKQ